MTEENKATSPEDDGNEQSTDQTELENLAHEEEPNVDYKSLYEQEKIRVNKISDDYKNVERERNKLKSSMVNTRKVLEENKLAKFDENWNPTIFTNNKTNEQVDLLEKYNSDLKNLKRQYNEGDIDQDEYSEKMTDIAVKKGQETFRREMAAEKKAGQEKKELDRQEQIKTSINDKALNILNTQYSEHNNESSELFKEMKRLYTEDPDLYTEDMNKNFKARLGLVKHAVLNLKAKGIEVAGITKQRADVVRNNYNTLDSSGPGSPEKAFSVKSSEVSKYLESKYDKKTIESLSKMFKGFEGYSLKSAISIPS
jgi:hypothetical protein